MSWSQVLALLGVAPYVNAISSPFDVAAAASWAMLRHLPRSLHAGSPGHLSRPQSAPSKPSAQVHAPVTRSQRPRPEHSAGEPTPCAKSAAVGRANQLRPKGHVRSEQSDPVNPVWHSQRNVGAPRQRPCNVHGEPASGQSSRASTSWPQSPRRPSLPKPSDVVMWSLQAQTPMLSSQIPRFAQTSSSLVPFCVSRTRTEGGVLPTVRTSLRSSATIKGRSPKSWRKRIFVVVFANLQKSWPPLETESADEPCWFDTDGSASKNAWTSASEASNGMGSVWWPRNESTTDPPLAWHSMLCDSSTWAPRGSKTVPVSGSSPPGHLRSEQSGPARLSSQLQPKSLSASQMAL
mmetsp:Transcript_8567/g.28195  ORF Transcript_8567/g.28195 Transcript_8567/m.28195 type:complete len:349 (-) Transcript_8567:543-1589(-)